MNDILSVKETQRMFSCVYQTIGKIMTGKVQSQDLVI